MRRGQRGLQTSGESGTFLFFSFGLRGGGLEPKATEERRTVLTQGAKLKTVIRARAAKTGESYTAARRHVLAGKPRPAVALVSPAPKPPVVEATPARDPRVPRGELSNKTAIKCTGHDLEYWFKVRDKIGTKNHAKAAHYL